MKIDQIAFEICHGVFLVPDELLRTMGDDPNRLGTTVYDVSAETVDKQWTKLVQACPEIDTLSFENKEQLKCRFFTPSHILLVGSLADSEQFRHCLEHEWFHKLCFSSEEKEILFKAFKEIYSDRDLSFIAMDFFTDSPYGRFPDFDEFWAQWFRPGLFKGDELELWGMFKEKVRRLQSETISKAVNYVDRDLSFRVIHEVSILSPAIQETLERYRQLPKELNLRNDQNLKQRPLLKETLLIQGKKIRLEWDKNKNTGPTVSVGDKKIAWMHLYNLDSNIKSLRFCIQGYAGKSEYSQDAIAAMMIANSDKIINAVHIWTEAETYEYTFHICAYTRHFLNAKDSEEQTYWRNQVIENLDKLYGLLELEKIVWGETIPYHSYFFSRFWEPLAKSALKQYLES